MTRICCTKKGSGFTTCLSNQGYFKFNRQYISFNVDNTSLDKAVIVETVIGLPSDSDAHPICNIARIEWEISADQATVQQPISYRGITFKGLTGQFSPKVLATNIPLRSPQLYRKNYLIETHRRLSNLDMFRYINITHDMVDNGKLVTRIHTKPLDRFQISNELGLQVSYWVPRPFYMLSLKSRNFFHRLETLTLAANWNVEGVIAMLNKQGHANSQSVGVDIALAFPQFLLPLSSSKHTSMNSLNPITRLELGYTFTKRPDYTQSIFKGLMQYSWKGLGNGAYELVPVHIDRVDTPKISPVFKEYLEQLRKKGNNLYKTFKSSWVGRFLLRVHLSNLHPTKTSLIPA